MRDCNIKQQEHQLTYSTFILAKWFINQLIPFPQIPDYGSRWTSKEQSGNWGAACHVTRRVTYLGENGSSRVRNDAGLAENQLQQDGRLNAVSCDFKTRLIGWVVDWAAGLGGWDVGQGGWLGGFSPLFITLKHQAGLIGIPSTMEGEGQAQSSSNSSFGWGRFSLM